MVVIFRTSDSLFAHILEQKSADYDPWRQICSAIFVNQVLLNTAILSCFTYYQQLLYATLVELSTVVSTETI